MNKKGVNTLYTSSNFHVAKESLVGFRIKKGDKHIIPYKQGCYHIEAYGSTSSRGVPNFKVGGRIDLTRYTCREYSMRLRIKVESRFLCS